MEKIDAYLTEDNTLFRVKAEAERYEEKKRLKRKLEDALFFSDDLIGGAELLDFIKKHRNLVIEVLGIDYDYMARWQAENK